MFKFIIFNKENDESEEKNSFEELDNSNSKDFIEKSNNLDLGFKKLLKKLNEEIPEEQNENIDFPLNEVPNIYEHINEIKEILKPIDLFNEDKILEFIKKFGKKSPENFYSFFKKKLEKIYEGKCKILFDKINELIPKKIELLQKIEDNDIENVNLDDLNSQNISNQKLHLLKTLSNLNDSKENNRVRIIVKKLVENEKINAENDLKLEQKKEQEFGFSLFFKLN